MKRAFLIGLMVALAGCDRGSATEPDDGPAAPTSTTNVELRTLFPSGAVLVGVTVTPNGKRYVLDQRSGLYEVGASSAKLVFNTTGLNGVELTDVVALDDDRFALTAENDGFLYDTRTQAFTSYFCYLPSPPAQPQDMPAAGGSPSQVPTPPLSVSQTLQLNGISVKQRTESVAFNPDTRQLFAQPRTTRLDDGSIAGSELFVFNEAGGEPIRVLPFASTDFAAAGMVAAPGDQLLLASGSNIYEATLDGELKLYQRLDSAIDITGMARAPDGGVWLLDGAAERLIRFDLRL
jgi:hypothetical protein